MTTIQEEDDLFGASLSKDFYSPIGGRRPWQSSPLAARGDTSHAQRNLPDSHPNNRSFKQHDLHHHQYREPYELLDDVPPAFTTNTDSPHTHTTQRSTATAAVATTTPPQNHQYLVEEIYPTVDTHGNGSVKHSRYPIDDDVNGSVMEEADVYYSTSAHNTHRNEQYKYNGADDDVLSITESRSDSEISTYHTIMDDDHHNEDSEKTDGNGSNRYEYEYDDLNNQRDSMVDDTTSKASNGNKSNMGQDSISSFDRLYNDEVTGAVDSTYSPSSNVSSKRSSNTDNDNNSIRILDDDDDDDNANDDEGIRESTKWTNIKVDVKSSTQQRSTLFRKTRPASPYYEIVSDTSPKEEEEFDTISASPNSPNMPMESSINNGLPPSPPRSQPHNMKRQSRVASSDIFRIHGTDSCLSSKSSGVGRLGHIGGDSIESGGANSMASSSIMSTDSAIQHLVSFQQQKVQAQQARGEKQQEEQEEGEGIEYYSSSRSSPTLSHDSTTSNHNQQQEEVVPALNYYYYTTPNYDQQHVSHNANRKADPPTNELGMYPSNEDAKDPVGYRQNDPLFPDVDLWGDAAPSIARARASEETATATTTTGRLKVTVKEETNRYYEPEYNDQEEEEEQYTNSSPKQGRYYEIDDDNESDGGLEYYGKYEEDLPTSGMDAIGYKSQNGQLLELYRPTTVGADNDIMDAEGDNDNDKYYSLSSNDDDEDGDNCADSGVSAISDDIHSTNKGTRHQSKSHYQVKQKDSMEEDNKVDNREKKKKVSSRGGTAGSYMNVKCNDSMENDMSIDVYDENHKNVVHAHPENDRHYKDEDGDRDDHSVISEYNDNMVTDRYNDHQRSNRPVVSNSTRYYSFSDDDESEASDDPNIFPSKAISQMNLGIHDNDDDTENESEDLVEQACYHLSRGRNDEALDILNEALVIAQENVTDAKTKMDHFYFQKKRRHTSKYYEEEDEDEDEIMYEEDEVEDRLDTQLRSAASQMANVINNIGVVYEMKGDYQMALKSFRDALDVYRNQCHRYENAGDNDVDRTVNNIMMMGIAMRSQNKRLDLHQEEAELAVQTARWQNSDDHHGLCTQLRMARLNLLMCVLDIETESLGQDHPTVGFTLMTKGELHLEMMHVDMAIKDTRDAISILKKGLGDIHPEVGLAFMRLGDMYNYHLGKYGDNKDVALSLYKEALTPLRQSFGSVSSPLGLVYNSIGILHSSRGDAKHAMSSFYAALASFGVRSRADISASKGEPQSSRPDVFFSWINVAKLHMMMDEWQLALRSYSKALSAFNFLDEDDKMRLQTIGQRRLMKNALSLSKGQLSFKDHDVLLAAVLQNIGRAQSMLHQYGKAIESLEEALRIHQVVAMRTTRTKSFQDVACILENLGEVQMISGDLTSAFSRYVESLTLLRSNKLSKNSIEVALVLGGIGQVHLKKKEYAEAKVVLKECMRSLESMGVPPNNRRINEIRSCLVDSELALLQSATTTLAGQRLEISPVPYIDKALAIDEIANSYRNKGDCTASIWFYSEALIIRRKRVEQKLRRGRRDSSEIVDVGRTVSNIAQLRRDMREFGAAKILFDEVKQLYRSVGLSPEHTFYKDLLDEIEVTRKM